MQVPNRTSLFFSLIFWKIVLCAFRGLKVGSPWGISISNLVEWGFGSFDFYFSHIA